MFDDLHVIQRSLVRERMARKKAESLLEAQQMETWERQNELEAIATKLYGRLKIHEEAIDLLPRAVVLLDDDGTIALFNREAQRLFGQTGADVVGTSIRPMMPTIFQPEHTERLRDDLLAEGETHSFEASCRRTDGTALHVDLTTAVSFGTGAPRLILLLSAPERTTRQKPKSQSVAPPVREATDIGLAGFLAGYEQLREKIGEGASSDQLIQHIDVLVQDLVLGNKSTLQPSSQEINAANPREFAKRGKRVVRAAHQFSYAASRKVTSLNDAVQSAVAEKKSMWEPAAALVMDLHPDLPSVRGERDEYNVIFEHLIRNAVNAIREAARNGKYDKGNINIISRFDDERIMVRIIDDGCGMPSYVREKVFDPSFTTRSSDGGEGLGLTECRETLKTRLNAEISATSTPGEGSTFEIVVPQRTNSVV